MRRAIQLGLQGQVTIIVFIGKDALSGKSALSKLFSLPFENGTRLMKGFAHTNV